MVRHLALRRAEEPQRPGTSVMGISWCSVETGSGAGGASDITAESEGSGAGGFRK